MAMNINDRDKRNNGKREMYIANITGAWPPNFKGSLEALLYSISPWNVGLLEPVETLRPKNCK